MSGLEWDILLRAVVAALLGYVVGAEREYIAHREAGTSTFSLVSFSSALVTAAAFLVFDPTGASRVVANVLVGVGFLGGGMIVKDLVHVRGLGLRRASPFRNTLRVGPYSPTEGERNHSTHRL